MTPDRDSRASFIRLLATTCVAIVVAGCAGRSLNQPQVLDWSNGAQPPLTQVGQPSTAAAADPAVLYTVRRDDTLASIASRFNTTPSTLAAWNGLLPNARVQPNQVLRIAPPGATAPVDSNPVATTQPIGSGGIEQRALGAPAGSTPLPPSVALPPSSGSSNAPMKTGPLGVRRPYADATLAELARPDGDAPSPSTPAAAPTIIVPPATAAPSMTWSWPAGGKPGAAYDEKSKGIDFAGKAGDPVLAAGDGKVTFAGTGVHGYGKLVIVQHSPNLLSVYAHNRTNLVTEGSTVTRGQKIAEMGDTESDRVKLHFEIRRDSKPVDPLQYLPPR